MKNHLSKCLLVSLSLIIMLIADPAWAGWNRSSIGTVTNWAYGIAVGPGRNDGINRVYVASWSRLYEFTWNGSSWDRVDMGATLGWEVALGAGRNDDTIRVYCTFTVTNPQYGGVYEYTWDGSTWQRQTVYTFPSMSSAGHGIVVGPGRNDRINRVYACDCNSNRTYESTWNGSSWNTVEAISDWCGTEIVIGPGRNDNVQRVYLAYIGRQLREYTWTGSGWTYVNIDPTSSNYYDVWIGNGRNDGTIRIYSGNAAPYSLTEFTWNGSGWNKAVVGPMPNIPNCITVGPGRNDAINRIYSGTTGGTRYALEYSWNSTQWDSTWVDASGTSSVAYCDAIVAKGRNDNVNRLYMTSSDQNIYEFTYTTDVEEENIVTHPTDAILKVYPNPFTKKTHINFEIRNSKFETNANFQTTLNIYDATGRLVKSFPLATRHSLLATSSIVWDGADNYGHCLPAGIYIVQLETGSARTSSTITILR